jgi:hypothetical protein
MNKNKTPMLPYSLGFTKGSLDQVAESTAPRLFYLFERVRARLIHLPQLDDNDIVSKI